MNNTSQLDMFQHVDVLSAVDRQNIKAAIKFYSTKCWYLPLPLQENYFSSYYLIYWSGSYLSEQMQNAEGYLVRKNNWTDTATRYKIAYHRNLNRGKILMQPTAQFALSFRTPAAEWNLEPVVLISATATGTKANV